MTFFKTYYISALKVYFASLSSMFKTYDCTSYIFSPSCVLLICSVWGLEAGRSTGDRREDGGGKRQRRHTSQVCFRQAGNDRGRPGGLAWQHDLLTIKHQGKDLTGLWLSDWRLSSKPIIKFSCCTDVRKGLERWIFHSLWSLLFLLIEWETICLQVRQDSKSLW